VGVWEGRREALSVGEGRLEERAAFEPSMNNAMPAMTKITVTQSSRTSLERPFRIGKTLV
jgi:hypothetical protein